MQGKNYQHDPFLAISDPTRRSIMGLLKGNELSIRKIAENYTISRTAVIKHLNILNDSGLLEKRTYGRESLYRINGKPLLDILKWVSFFDVYWDEKLMNLKSSAERDYHEDTP